MFSTCQLLADTRMPVSMSEPVPDCGQSFHPAITVPPVVTVIAMSPGAHVWGTSSPCTVHVPALVRCQYFMLYGEVARLITMWAVRLLSTAIARTLRGTPSQ